MVFLPPKVPSELMYTMMAYRTISLSLSFTLFRSRSLLCVFLLRFFDISTAVDMMKFFVSFQENILLLLSVFLLGWNESCPPRLLRFALFLFLTCSFLSTGPYFFYRLK